ncbi:MAG: hypothetical protein LC740_06955 [Actinobacteria bacterium]|nr:hypothetical protein [Actinomycetota bacterium]
MGGRRKLFISSPDLIRWGGLAAITGGVVWVVHSGLLLLATSESAVTDVLFIIAALCTVGGFVGFHALQKDNYGRIGRGGLWTVVVATLALVVGLIVLLLGSMALEELFFPVGTFAVFTGFTLYGAATLQARVLPRWCGIGFIVGPFMFLLGDFGGILFGLLWLALGYMLWAQRDMSVGQPSRVS